MIDHLIECRIDEPHELEFGDGPESLRCQADRHSRDDRFGERRVTHALLAEARLQSVGGAEDAAIRADVFAKLIAYFNSHRSGVRAVFIHAGGTFTLENVRAGTYEVHYLDLDNGIVQRSGAFTVPETKSLHGASTVAVALLAATRSPRDPQFTSGADF